MLIPSLAVAACGPYLPPTVVPRQNAGAEAFRATLKTCRSDAAVSKRRGGQGASGSEDGVLFQRTLATRSGEGQASARQGDV